MIFQLIAKSIGELREPTIDHEYSQAATMRSGTKNSC